MYILLASVPNALRETLSNETTHYKSETWGQREAGSLGNGVSV